MDLIVEPSQEVSGEVSPSPSKFYTQYSSVIGLLAEGESVIKSPLLVDDTRDLMKAIDGLGATTKRSKKKWTIWGNEGTISPEGQVIDAKKSIMSLSLLASLSALTSRIMVTTGNKVVRRAPLPSLIKSLQKMGVDMHSTNDNESAPLVTFQSNIKGGKISLEGDGIDSSIYYFMPAILLLASLAEETWVLEIDQRAESRFLDGSLELLDRSGIVVSREEQSLKVDPGEFEPIEIEPPRDLFSTLPYVTGALLTSSELEISGIEGCLGRRDFENLLGEFGVDLEENGGSLKIPSGQNLEGAKIDLGEYSDLLPFFAVLGCKAEGKTQLLNTDCARRMKSDRIEKTVEGLEKMGADITEDDDGVTVEGPSNLSGEVVDGYNDVAIVSALGVAGLVAEGRTVIKNRAEALRQSYPQFVTIFKNLGAGMSYES